jgi:hypothetical protein
MGCTLSVLAQSTAIESVGVPLPGLNLSAVALGVGAIALALLAAMIVSSLISASARRETNNPRRLFYDLCEAHGFARRQQRALISAASTLGVWQPARFFLEPALLRMAARHPKLSARHNDLAEIASELFGPA